MLLQCIIVHLLLSKKPYSLDFLLQAIARYRKIGGGQLDADARAAQAHTRRQRGRGAHVPHVQGGVVARSEFCPAAAP
jgi:hypothetical protein